MKELFQYPELKANHGYSDKALEIVEQSFADLHDEIMFTQGSIVPKLRYMSDVVHSFRDGALFLTDSLIQTQFHNKFLDSDGSIDPTIGNVDTQNGVKAAYEASYLMLTSQYLAQFPSKFRREGLYDALQDRKDFSDKYIETLDPDDNIRLDEVIEKQRFENLNDKLTLLAERFDPGGEPAGAKTLFLFPWIFYPPNDFDIDNKIRKLQVESCNQTRRLYTEIYNIGKRNGLSNKS